MWWHRCIGTISAPLRPVKPSCAVSMIETSAGLKSVDIKATAAKHAYIASELLPAHALSGCDTVSQLYWSGKGEVLKKLSNYSLDKLGVLHDPIEDVITQETIFMTAYYGSVDTYMTAARIKVWCSKFGIKILKSAPPMMSLPPTSDSFLQHVYRAYYQAAIWRPSVCRSWCFSRSNWCTQIDQMWLQIRQSLLNCTVWLLCSSYLMFNVLLLSWITFLFFYKQLGSEVRAQLLSATTGFEPSKLLKSCLFGR